MIQAKNFKVAPGWRIILKDLGGDENEVLKRARLPLDLFVRKNVSLTAEEYFRLWDSLEASLNDPLFPLKLGQRASTETFSPPVFAALCCPDLNTALARLSKFKQLIGPLVLNVVKKSSATIVQIDCLNSDHPLPDSLIAMELVFLVHLARLATREKIIPIEINTLSNHLAQEEYKDFFGTRIIKANESEIHFSPKDAQLPFLTENAKLLKFFESDLEQQLSKIKAEDKFAQKVQRSLFELLPSGLATADSVAENLVVSRRTLQRMLKNEGTTFRQELNLTREKLARHYLTNSTLPGAEISFLLGFDDPNSFARAFRSWTGTTPDKVRSELIH